MARNSKFETYTFPKTFVDIATWPSGHYTLLPPNGRGFDPNSELPPRDAEDQGEKSCCPPSINDRSIPPHRPECLSTYHVEEGEKSRCPPSINDHSSPPHLQKCLSTLHIDGITPTFAVAPPPVPTTKPSQILGELHQVFDGSATAPVPPESPQVNPHISHGFDSRGVSSSPPAE